MNEILNVHELAVGFGGKRVLSGITFSMDAGETVAIIGPNGVGKTLLLKTLLGAVSPVGGTYEWKGSKKIGYVPQKFAIDKNVPITVGEFLTLKSKARKEKVLETMKDVGLAESFYTTPVRLLSGGQFQRMIVAWAVVDDPAVLMFDEPTESIDMAGQACIYSLIDSLKKSRNISVFLVTHDLDVAYAHADRVLYAKKGRMIMSGNPRDLIDHKALEEIYGGDIHHGA